MFERQQSKNVSSEFNGAKICYKRHILEEMSKLEE